MKPKTIWSHYSKAGNYPALKKNITAEAAIIGGGITGISTGLLLAQNGIDVAVFESHKAGGGATAHSTGNLYITIDKLLSSLLSKYNMEVIVKVAESRIRALEKINDWIESFYMDCDYSRVPWYLYSNEDDSIQKIDSEFETGIKAGLPFRVTDQYEIPFPHKNGIKLLHQNQVNPMKYVQELAEIAHKKGCSIFEHTPVHSIENKKDHFVLHSNGIKVKAKYVVHATHTPKGIKMVQTVLGPYREYGIACRLNSRIMTDGIYWGFHEDGKKISTRVYTKHGKHYLIVVGEPHKTGQADSNKHHIQQLENFAHKYFDIQDIEYRWGGQNFKPADHLPYIGPESKNSREIIATGFSTDGLVYGTLSAMIISDQIAGRENEWAELYNAARHQPFKSAPDFIKENVNVAKQYVKDYAGNDTGSKNLKAEDIPAGEGRVIKHDGEKLAVYRNKENKLEAVSAVCTHMSCLVHWNNAENTWDCPCHGSRFKTDGAVLEGPALNPLKKVTLKQEDFNK